MAFEDKTLTCRDCASSFVFSAGEQEFFQLKRLENEPGRCPSCRAAYKRARGGWDAGGYREYHITVCAQCGGEARVPFIPSNDRPVYCSSCFDGIRATQSQPSLSVGAE